MSNFEQQDRQPTDGGVTVTRAREGHISISVTTSGVMENIECSEFNASRVFAMLSLMLGIPVASGVLKRIKMG